MYFYAQHHILLNMKCGFESERILLLIASNYRIQIGNQSGIACLETEKCKTIWETNNVVMSTINAKLFQGVAHLEINALFDKGNNSFVRLSR